MVYLPNKQGSKAAPPAHYTCPNPPELHLETEASKLQGVVLATELERLGQNKRKRNSSGDELYQKDSKSCGTRALFPRTVTLAAPSSVVSQSEC